MNGNLFVPFYVIVKGNVYDEKQALFGNSETLTLWRIYINRNSYFKHNELERENYEPIKEVSVEEANELVENGYYLKPVFINENCKDLDEKFYETEVYFEGDERKTFKQQVRKEYNEYLRIVDFNENGTLFDSKEAQTYE
jgi:hypothetical protein